MMTANHFQQWLCRVWHVTSPQTRPRAAEAQHRPARFVD
jgi:hypothetical protein